MIEIRKGDTLRTTWEELKISIKNNTSSLNVGDEIDIELKTGEKVTLVCERMGHRNATFFTKDLLEDTHCMNENWKAKNGERLSTMESYLSKLFRLLPDDLQEVIIGPLRLLREKEVFGENNYGKVETCEALPRYSKMQNRIKTLSGIPFLYWLATPDATDAAYFCRVFSDGSCSVVSASYSFGVCFGFDI